MRPMYRSKYVKGAYVSEHKEATSFPAWEEGTEGARVMLAFGMMS